MGAALADRFFDRGSEDLKQVFAAGDAMARLLGQAYEYIKKKDPKEAEEFARAAERAVTHYRKHAARYLEMRG
jgi:Na+/phosphate symporter